MKKKLVSALTCGVLSIGLVGCGSEEKTTTNSTTKNEVQTEEAVKDATVIRGTGAHRLTSVPPMIPLEKGKATLKVNVKGADKSKEFSASVIQHLEHGGSASSIADVSRKGNLPDSDTFDVPSPGNYDINLHSDDDFKGEWEVIIEQKVKKDKEYDKQLRLTTITQQIGGEFSSSASLSSDYKQGTERRFGMEYGYDMKNFTIANNNSISFQSIKDGNFVITELKDGKWKQIEKDTGKTQSEMQEIRGTYSGAQIVAKVTTTKGPAELLSHNGKYILIYENINKEAEEVTVPKELISLFKTGLRDVYWDFDNNIIYAIVTDTMSSNARETLMYRYDLKKQTFILDEKGKKTTPIPLKQSSERIHFANDKKGNLYLAGLPTNATSGDLRSVSVVVFNKDMKLLAKPTPVNAIYYNYEIVGTDKGVDIWNVYNSKIVNGGKSSEPLKVGANRFSLSLE
ncbi:hypothetical protein bcgnr5390_11600 [Bacillus luti]|nr:hypothetical protein BC2903_29310 [Bacillus cereus]